jgi:SAM-dependent methyltransferase
MTQFNKKLWANYERFAAARGEMVTFILSRHLNLRHVRILDFGAGTGGVSLELAKRGAFVTAVELNPEKRELMTRQGAPANLHVLESLPDEGDFDAVVLLDVIEHLPDWREWLRCFHQRLAPGGVIYLSTPNKFSPLNLLCDPHFSLPGIALLKRKWVKSVVADFLGLQPKERVDFPELLSLRQLDDGIRAAGFTWRLINKSVAEYALEHPQALWNRPLHLVVVNQLRQLSSGKALLKLVSDEVVFFNFWINPAWYMLLEKPASSFNV